MHTTIIQHPPLRLIATRPRSFPEGIPGAFDSLEEQLPSLRGRKFYGLAYVASEPREYVASLVPTDRDEERRFLDKGCEIREIPGGACARVKLTDWQTKIDQLPAIFSQLVREHGMDPTRPQIEFYRSLRELHLLVPLPD